MREETDLRMLDNMERPNSHDRSSCPIQPDLDRLTGAIEILVAKMENLLQLNREIIRWLLIVVCVIALGRSAFDVSKDLLERVTSPVRTESRQ
jgi:hypothetical protein